MRLASSDCNMIVKLVYRQTSNNCVWQVIDYIQFYTIILGVTCTHVV